MTDADKMVDERLVKAGFPADPLLFDLEQRLCDLAADWYGTKADSLVAQYQAILRCMIALGWDGNLTPVDELPEELMPQEYWDYLKRKYPVAESPQE